MQPAASRCWSILPICHASIPSGINRSNPLGRDTSPTDRSHWEARRDPDETAQHLSDLAEIETRLEMLNKGEHVALGAARRVPPAVAAMVDDDDLAWPTPVFQGVARALALVERPAAPELFKEGSTIHAAPEQLQLRVV